ncbi:ATP-binding protein [Spongiactinospora sp. TRM90649]|uniref:ATP-binding protein n=1 Tax=Spongiactinospora sp. TRM90649 TaxID=3031114 RepID=UPI0023F9DED6|nr:ATP-binding protein [Spongiactinospora sp. TRM90649]MDF5757797.1 ATP-binding protein [Spongiactinospora sp. TRM90649]
MTVLGELIANAVTHTRSGLPGGCYDLALIASRDWVRMEITDEGADTEPRSSAAADDSEHGRGLLMVEALSDEWGHRPWGQGRIVWAIFRRAET